MQASIFYRIAAVLLLLFAAGHTLGIRQSDPNWGVDAAVGSMRSIRFDVLGFNRTLWDFFVAAGFSVGLFYVFAAILAWQSDSAIDAGRSLPEDLGAELGESGSTATAMAPASHGAGAHADHEPVARSGALERRHLGWSSAYSQSSR
jgi:hypothetical protein